MSSPDLCKNNIYLEHDKNTKNPTHFHNKSLGKSVDCCPLSVDFLKILNIIS